jgi:acyl-CoA-binding protein
MVARAKWDAWAKLEGTTPDEAKQQYIDLIESLR